MGINIVRQPLLVAFATLLLLTCGAMVYVASAEATSDGVLPSLLGDSLATMQETWPVAAKIVSALLLLSAGLMLGRMTARYNLYSTHTLLVIPIYGIYACGILSGGEYVIQSLLSICFVISMSGFYACFRSGSYGFGDIFKGTFFLGLTPLFYIPALGLMLVVPLVIVVFKRSMREVIVAVIGYIFPFFATSYLYWLAGCSPLVPYQTMCDVVVSSNGLLPLKLDMLSLAMLATIGLLSIFSALSYYFDLYATTSKSRTILLFNLLLLPITVAMLFVPCSTPASTAFIAVPASVVLPVLLVRLNRWVSSTIYLVILLICLLRFIL